MEDNFLFICWEIYKVVGLVTGLMMCYYIIWPLEPGQVVWRRWVLALGILVAFGLPVVNVVTFVYWATGSRAKRVRKEFVHRRARALYREQLRRWLRCPATMN